MPTFAYSGRTRAGQTVTGERIADTMDAAVAALRREQIMVTRIDPAKAPARVEAKAEAKPNAPNPGKGVPAKNLAIFTRQFSVMIDAVPRHPRQAGAAQELLGRHPQSA